MSKVLLVAAATKEDAAVEAALIIEKRGHVQRITGEPVWSGGRWSHMPSIKTWKVPVMDNEQPAPEWQAHVCDDYSGAMGLLRDGDERYTLPGISKKQADYALTILNNGGIDTNPVTNPDWVEALDDMITLTTCDRCNMDMFRGEAKPDDEWVLCKEHQS